MQPLTGRLGVDLQGTAEVPHGSIVGGRRGQVEVFAASGAVRARNAEQRSRFADERRPWADVRREETGDGVAYRLSDDSEQRLASSALRLLASTVSPTTTRASGYASASGPFSTSRGRIWSRDPDGPPYSSGTRSRGSGSSVRGQRRTSTFDPDDSGQDGVVARLFHVNCGFDGSRDVPLLGIEQAFRPLLSQTWSGRDLDPGSAHMSIIAIDYGLLALPADVLQRFAAPALAVQGRITGVDGGDGREVELRFAQYLPLADADVLEAGFASSSRLIPGSVVKRQSKGE